MERAVYLKPFLKDFGQTRLGVIEYRHLETYSMKLLKQYDHNTVREYYRVVKQFYKWCQRNN